MIDGFWLRTCALAMLFALAAACGSSGPNVVSSEAAQPTVAPSDPAAPAPSDSPEATDSPDSGPTTAPSDSAATAGGADSGPTGDGDVRCLVYLHGKGGSGGSTSTNDDGIVIVSPDGNGTGWGALQWEYDSAASFDEAVASIRGSIDAASCDRVVVHGFSNGASMAAALQCSGDTLNERLAGIIVDDPVTDAATIGCTPATDQLALYWTGALASAAPVGTNCAQIDWTCAGDSIRGVDAYASDLGVSVTPSPHSDHQWNFETELPASWLG